MVFEIGKSLELSLRDSVREKERNRLAVVSTTTSLGKSRADIDSLDTVAGLLLLSVGNGVGNDETVETAGVQVLDGLAGENAVNDDGVDFLSTVLHDGVGGLNERAAGIGHIVDDDGDLVLHVAD